MTYLFYSIRASPAQMRCEPSCTAYLFPHFCHRFAPPKTTSLPKKFFSFAVKRCIMLLECAAFCFLWEIFVICQKSLPLQFIPARGRKLICGNVHGFYSGIAIYPREGTKTTTILTIAKSLLLQFIPARGRKHPRIAEKLRRCVLLQFIPARGRKQIKFISKSFSLTLQFIPARGRKRIVARCHHNQPALQFIPARGRKQK